MSTYNPDRREYFRTYMKKWRDANPDKYDAFKVKERERQRVYRLAAKGDGDRDVTAFTAESDDQSAAWAKLLGGAR
jgi:hypothetical protein